MKKKVFASKLSTFLKYHEDEDNYAANPDGFDKMYSILEKYDNSNGNDPVDIPFQKATPEDQDRMIALIKPGYKFGQKGYAQDMYYRALDMDIDNADPEYCKGVVDAIEALFAEGWIDENKFRTDL